MNDKTIPFIFYHFCLNSLGEKIEFKTLNENFKTQSLRMKLRIKEMIHFLNIFQIAFFLIQMQNLNFFVPHKRISKILTLEIKLKLINLQQQQTEIRIQFLTDCLLMLTTFLPFKENQSIFFNF